MYQSLFQKYCKSNNFPISMTYRNECLFLTHMPMVWLRQCCSMCLSRAQVRKSWIRATYVFFSLDMVESWSAPAVHVTHEHMEEHFMSLFHYWHSCHIDQNQMTKFTVKKKQSTALLPRLYAPSNDVDIEDYYREVLKQGISQLNTWIGILQNNKSNDD